MSVLSNYLIPVVVVQFRGGTTLTPFAAGLIHLWLCRSSQAWQPIQVNFKNFFCTLRFLFLIEIRLGKRAWGNQGNQVRLLSKLVYAETTTQNPEVNSRPSFLNWTWPSSPAKKSNFLADNVNEVFAETVSPQSQTIVIFDDIFWFLIKAGIQNIFKMTIVIKDCRIA